MSDAAPGTAERVLELAAAAAPGAEASVTVRRGTSALTRFATSFIHQNVAEEVSSVSLTVALGGRTASSAVNQLDDDALRRLVDRAVAAARVRPVDPGWPGLAPSSPATGPERYDAATAAADPDARAARVADFVAAAGGLETAGFCSTDAEEVVHANSAGQRLTGRATEAALDGVARTGSSDGSGRISSAVLADLDGTATGRRAAAKARDGAAATDLEPGHYEVVIEPACVADLLTFLAFYGFNARAVAEGRSFAELGAAQFDPAVDLVDDATDPLSVGLLFDSEGTPKRRVELVRGGTTVGLAHDRRTAAAAGDPGGSTGHAIPGGESWGALPVNLRLAPGDRTPQQLVAAVERGLLVTDFWYTRILDPRTQVVTGLTRNGVFLIEGGEVTRAVRNLRFTQSYVDALAPGRVLGVGDDIQLMPTSLGGGLYAVPSLRLADWHFSGGAKG